MRAAQIAEARIRSIPAFAARLRADAALFGRPAP